VPALTRTPRARRDDIVRAAIAVIDREGYGAASVERIAKEAATTKGTVLYHFKTKEGIDAAVVRQLFDTGAAYMTERILAVESPRDRLRAYLASNLRFIAEHAPHVNAVHRILEYAGPVEGLTDAVPPLRAMLSAGQAAGEFGEFDPEVMALAIRAIVDAASFHFTAHRELDVDHYINEAVRLFDKATAA
jgi:AcrR family transcriptional regulator